MKVITGRIFRGGGISCAFVAGMALFSSTLMVWSTARADGLTSDPAFVFLAPETSYFWRTATNNVMTLPVVFPDGADSATLAVTGLSYTASYPGITTNEFTLTLPPAGRPSEENVYDLTLTFNDGTIRSARLGLIQGFASGDEGCTRCIAPFGGSRWRKVEDRAVMPIPYGTKAFSFQVEGESAITETGLDGAAGWFAFELGGGERAAVSMTDEDDVDWSASLMGWLGGVLMMRYWKGARR